MFRRGRKLYLLTLLTFLFLFFFFKERNIYKGVILKFILVLVGKVFYVMVDIEEPRVLVSGKTYLLKVIYDKIVSLKIYSKDDVGEVFDTEEEVVRANKNNLRLLNSFAVAFNVKTAENLNDFDEVKGLIIRKIIERLELEPEPVSLSDV